MALKYLFSIDPTQSNAQPLATIPSLARCRHGFAMLKPPPHQFEEWACGKHVIN
ncbi:hypothetical protein Sjap_009120 [Stephania japonica]|uniref:Uncharacterized protein n=1 Tax=Stephania japonica TaxID=461633 RepID=A0AAP0JRK1_9MAGN